jgi:electron transfer flavoprotein alpha subunit
MGVGGPEQIAALEPLCALLGAELICTRDVVDAGWMTRQRQVGLTGRSVAPALYIGVGVRGDFNHTVGIQRAGTVVVVNNNKRAQFFRTCDLGIIADWTEFVPLLVEEIKARVG